MKLIWAMLAFVAGLVAIVKAFAERDAGHILWYFAFQLLCVGFCIAGCRLVAAHAKTQ
jgi:hypothetical protein